MFLQEQIGSGGSGERTRFLERSPRKLKAAEGQMLVQTSSPLRHCSPDPTNSLPPGVLQPKTYPPSERPVKHPSRSRRQYTWSCLHLRRHWGPGNCCSLPTCRRTDPGAYGSTAGHSNPPHNPAHETHLATRNIWHPPSSTALPVPTAAPSSSHPHSLPRPLDGNSLPQRDHFINYCIRPGHICPALTWLFKSQALSAIALPWP